MIAAEIVLVHCRNQNHRLCDGVAYHHTPLQAKGDRCTCRCHKADAFLVRHTKRVPLREFRWEDWS